MVRMRHATQMQDDVVVQHIHNKSIKMENWFKKLVGFEEENPEQVRENLILENGRLTSKLNGATYDAGKLEIPALHELRSRVPPAGHGKNKIKEVIGDVQSFHVDPVNDDAVFQAASQFNLLEMDHYDVTPEQGIGRYENDHTQGPACAMACGAGTIYRNYFVEVNGQTGQTRDNQIDCLSEIGQYFNNPEKKYWTMRNGYALVSDSGLDEITRQIGNLSTDEYEHLKGLLRVGIQKETQVTITGRPQRVTQVYCSALPVGYSDTDATKWEKFAGLILEATYEATMLAARENQKRTGNNKLFLTLVGGGAFGNKPEWIMDAVVKNLKKFDNCGLEVIFVSHRAPDETVGRIIEGVNG